MKKISLLFLCAFLDLYSEESSFEYDFQGEFKEAFVKYDYSNPDGIAGINKSHKDSEGVYSILKLSLKSDINKNVSFRATVAGVTDFGINDQTKETRTFAF